jgi:hypothetical protein
MTALAKPTRVSWQRFTHWGLRRTIRFSMATNAQHMWHWRYSSS